MKLLTKIVSTILVLLIATIGKSAFAADHEITALAVKFNPMFTYIEKGDTVSWSSMDGHNVETLDAMVPEGQKKINTELGANVSEVFETEGIVVYKCTPHWGARMGGIIVVGKPDDPAKVIEDYMAAIETDRAGLLPAKGLLKKLRKDMEAKGLL